MILEIFTKNFALTAELQVPDGPVPRVGETITLEQDVGYLQGMTELLVHEVTYVLENNALTPVIRCFARTGAENRRLILEENGWIK